MKRKLFITTVLFTGILNIGAVDITSPNGALRLNVGVDSKGTPVYSLDYKGRQIIADSRLGIKADETAFTDGFRIEGIDTVTFDRLNLTLDIYTASYFISPFILQVVLWFRPTGAYRVHIDFFQFLLDC